jgi:hypothetical protein
MKVSIVFLGQHFVQAREFASVYHCHSLRILYLLWSIDAIEVPEVMHQPEVVGTIRWLTEILQSRATSYLVFLFLLSASMGSL